MMKENDSFENQNKKWWQTNLGQNAIFIGIAIVFVYGFIYWDVRSRAKEAYLEAEKYMDWNKNPAKKKSFFEEKYKSDKAKLETEFKKNKITEENYREKLDVIEFDRDFNLNESSLKYAYQWYKDTHELFSPPNSKWVREARQKEPKALALWKEELTQKKIPFEDYMFE